MTGYTVYKGKEIPFGEKTHQSIVTLIDGREIKTKGSKEECGMWVDMAINSGCEVDKTEIILL